MTEDARIQPEQPVPRILAPDKADHPFRGIGYMINADGHVYLREASAPTLVGYAYGDYGLRSTIAYLSSEAYLRACIVNGDLRTALFPVVAYVFFSLLGGVSAEGGMWEPYIRLSWCSCVAFPSLLWMFSIFLQRYTLSCRYKHGTGSSGKLEGYRRCPINHLTSSSHTNSRNRFWVATSTNAWWWRA